MNNTQFFLMSDIQPGGEWNAVQNMICALKKKKHEVEIIYIGFCHNKRLLLKNVFAHITLLHQSRITKPPFHIFRALWEEYTCAIASISYNIQRFSPACIISTHYLLTLSAIAAARKKHIPVIHWFHGFQSCFFIDNTKRTWKERILFYLEKYALRKSSIIIVPSEQSRDTLFRAIGPRTNIEVIHNKINEEFYKNISDKDKNEFRRLMGISFDTKIIAYVGRIAPYKGIETLVDAYFSINHKKYNILLILAFPSFPLDTVVFKSIQKKIKDNSKGKSVRFVSGLNIYNLKRLYRIAEAVFLPSLSENSPLTMWECMASGGLFVGSPAGDMGEILKSIDSRLVIRNISVYEVNKSIQWVLSMSDKENLLVRKQLKEKAQESMNGTEIERLYQLLNF